MRPLQFQDQLARAWSRFRGNASVSFTHLQALEIRRGLILASYSRVAIVYRFPYLNFCNWESGKGRRLGLLTSAPFGHHQNGIAHALLTLT